jgi:prepilin-type N-terminal cleavage/methylation domain-containing protein
MRKTRSGFTIVELLIVIVVIGVLAAITAVAYNGIQNRVRVATIQSDLNSLAKKLAAYYAINDAYPNNLTAMKTLDWRASFGSYQQTSGGNLLYCVVPSGTAAKYTISARTADNAAFTYSSGSGLQSYGGAWTGAWATDCPIFGFTTSEPGFTMSQGYQPSTWGNPGWKAWTGGGVESW